MDGRFLAAGGTGLASTELYGFATVKTDTTDYAPGAIVTITGSGWQPGETVTLTLRESPLIDAPPSVQGSSMGTATSQQSILAGFLQRQRALLSNRGGKSVRIAGAEHVHG